MTEAESARLREKQIFEEYPVKKAVAAMIQPFFALLMTAPPFRLPADQPETALRKPPQL